MSMFKLVNLWPQIVFEQPYFWSNTIQLSPSHLGHDFFWVLFIVLRWCSPMLHITFYGGWWVGWSRVEDKIIVAKKAHPILPVPFWLRLDMISGDQSGWYSVLS